MARIKRALKVFIKNCTFEFWIPGFPDSVAISRKQKELLEIRWWQNDWSFNSSQPEHLNGTKEEVAKLRVYDE